MSTQISNVGGRWVLSQETSSVVGSDTQVQFNDGVPTGASLMTCYTSSFIDASGNGFTVTQFGDAVASSESPFSSSASWSNTFDGSGDYLTVPSDTAFVFGSGSFTVEFWIYMIGSENPGRVVNYWNSATTSAGSWEFLVANGNTIYFNASNNGVTNQVALSKGSLTRNTWYHVAGVRSGDVFSLYVNGTLAASTTQAITLQTTANFVTIASRRNDGFYAEPFNGNVSNLRIVKGTAIYTGNFTPPTAPFSTAVGDLPAGTSLLTCHTSSFIDSSTNNFTITAVGDSAVSSRSPFYSTSWSGVFDGSGDYLYCASNAAFGFGTGDFTIECWIKFSSFTTISPAMQCDSIASSTNDKWWFGYQVGVGLKMGRHATADAVSAAWTPVRNTWYHIAATRQSGTTRLFLNGVLSATDSVVFNGRSWGQNGFTIGAITTPYYLNGNISNVKVVKGTALYTTNFTLPTAPFATSAVFAADSSFTYNRATNLLAATIVSSSNLTGSLTKLSDGTNYLLPGTGITLTTGSSGAVTVASNNISSVATYMGAASVATLESTNSTSYVNLTTAGPSVTLTTGTSVICHMFSNVTSTVGSGTARISVDVSGATTIAASDNPGANGGGSVAVTASTTYNYVMAGAVIFTGLTPGSNTFKLQYRTTGNTGGFKNRCLVVQRLN